MTEAKLPESSSPAKPSGSVRRPIVVVAIVLVLGLAFWAYDSFKDDIWPKRFGEVVPGMVYRSGQISPRIIEKTLKQRNIQTIINLQSNTRDTDPVQNAEADAAKKLGITCFRYALSGDGTGELKHYADALQAMIESQKANKPVLIHCAAGTQRTGVAIAFYRILIENKPVADAYNEMLKYDTNPRKDLPALNYLNDHMAELAQMLVDRGIISKVPSPVPQFQIPAAG